LFVVDVEYVVHMHVEGEAAMPCGAYAGVDEKRGIDRAAWIDERHRSNRDVDRRRLRTDESSGCIEPHAAPGVERGCGGGSERRNAGHARSADILLFPVHDALIGEHGIETQGARRVRALRLEAPRLQTSAVLINGFGRTGAVVPPDAVAKPIDERVEPRDGSA